MRAPYPLIRVSSCLAIALLLPVLAAAQTGTITGTVTDSGTLAGINGITVRVYNSTFVEVASATTNGSGVYTTPAIAAGSYYVVTSGTGSYVNEIHKLPTNLACVVTCSPLTAVISGTAVMVPGGGTATIDFALDPGASIAGTVIADGGGGLAGISVVLIVRDGPNVSAIASAATEISGAYGFTRLPSGSYSVSAADLSGNRVAEVYDNLPCPGACSTLQYQQGQAIAVTAPTPVTGINFSLAPASHVTGTVTNLAMTPQVGLSVSIYSATGTFLTSSTTNGSGDYSIDGLAAGTYRVATDSTGLYLNEVWNDSTTCIASCTTAQIAAGTPVTVGAGATVADIDFALALAGSIGGTVTAQGSGTPLAVISVMAIDAGGAIVQSTFTQGSGVYELSQLTAGTYYVSVNDSNGDYLNEVYDDVRCAGVCSAPFAVAQGTAITVAAATAVTGKDLALSPAGKISGTVKEQGSLNPLNQVPVAVYTAAGDVVASTVTNASGVYQIGGLQTGASYRLSAHGVFQTPPYLGKVWDNKPCGVSCLEAEIAAGDPVAVTEGSTTTGKDFLLVQGGRISGTVTLEGTGTPVANAAIVVLNAAGAVANSATTNALGQYTVNGLTADTYFVATAVLSGAANEAYNNLPCPSSGCDSTFVLTGTPIPVTPPATVSGIDFSLLPLGGISGTVVDATTMQPVAGITLLLFSSSGDAIGTAPTNASGIYTFGGLASGTYRLVAGAFVSDYFAEVYDNIPCEGFCDADQIAAGTPIVVAAPAVASGKDFALIKGATISGTVTSGGLPLPSLNVLIIDDGGSPVSFGTTNSSGVYSAQGLTAGTYFVATSTQQNYFNEAYDDIDCGGDCSLNQMLAGTPIVLAPGDTATANFDLVKGASISGTVASAAGAPIEGVTVAVISATGDFAASGNTGSTGAYTTTNPLLAGTYYLYTSAPGHLNEYYDDVMCIGQCDPDIAVVQGTPIVVAAAAAITDRNFVLAPAARITGTVTASNGTPLEDVEVSAYDSAGSETAYGFTDEDGAYVLDHLLAGTYRIATSARGNYQDEVWDDIKCGRQCATARIMAGAPIVVGSTETASGKNFVLDAGARIVGTVTEAGTGTPLEEVVVVVLGANGFEDDAFTDEDGEFTLEGMAPGTYVLLTQQADDTGHLNEIFDDIPCPGRRCSLSQARRVGTPIVVAVGATATANFALPTGGSISGTVTDAATGAPIEGATVHAVVFLDEGTDTMNSEPTNASGQFTVNGLPSGTYYAFTNNLSGYFNEMYPDLRCVFDCDSSLAVAGSPIAVSAGAATPGIDFALTLGGRISGRVTNASTTAGVSDTFVSILDARGDTVSEAITSSTGDYATRAGLPTGSYYAVVEGNQGLVSEIYENLPCQHDCYARAAGTPIAVTVGETTSGKDFALEAGGRITGRITAEGTGAPLEEVEVRIVDAAGSTVDWTSTGADGVYTSDVGLLTGTYFVSTENYRGVIHERYDNQPCPSGCEPSQAVMGTPVVVTLPATTSGIDFALAAAVGVPGPPEDLLARADPTGVLLTWFPPGSGGAAVSYLLDAGLSPGTTALTIPVGDTTYLASPVPPGTYYLRVRGVNAAGTGPPSDEIRIMVGGANLAPGAPCCISTMMLGRKLIATWEPPFSGGPASDYILEAGSASGASDIATIPVSGRVFTYEPVPDGFYFLRVRARNAAGVSAASDEAMLVVGGVPSPPDAPDWLAPAVSGSTVTLSWFAPPGPVTGYIVEAGSAPDLSDLATVALGPATTVSFPGIPRGRYYVRIRAVNALGRSAVSPEEIVVVP